MDLVMSRSRGRFGRTVTFTAVLVLVGPVASVACSQDADPPVTTAGDPCSDGGAHVRLGGVTDEACRAYAEAESRGLVVADPAKAPTLTSPTASVPATPPPRFAWSAGTLARTGTRALDVRALFVATAWAHGDTTGDAYALHFRDGAGIERLRVLTTNREYVPDQATWDRVSAGGTLSVTVVGMKLTRNALATGTKPTANAPLVLTVAR